jgi:hypothetical protein
VKPVTTQPESGPGVEASEARSLRNYVGGEWRPASAKDVLEDRDPASGELAALVPLSDQSDVDAAVRAAREAQPAWRDVAPQRRARAIMRLRHELSEHREELARLVTDDMGKTLDDARGEVGRGIESVEAACAIPHLLKGENLEGVAQGVDVEQIRQPVGVVAAITPFNFPAMIPLWFLPFALACGNGFVLKPSERDPRPAELIFQLIDGIDEIPAGICNLVHGARDAVNALLDHPEVDAISFVGQATTARYVSERAAATGKRCQALGGAKNSLVVMPDADLELTVPGIMGSAFGAAGQRCLAGSVAVLVGDRERQDEVRDALVAAASQLRVGPGADDDVLVSDDAFQLGVGLDLESAGAPPDHVGVAVEHGCDVDPVLGEDRRARDRLAEPAGADQRDVVLALGAEDLADLAEEAVDVVAHPSLAELSERGQVTADLRRVDVRVVGHLLGGDALLPQLLGLRENLEVPAQSRGDPNRQPIRHVHSLGRRL